MKVKQLIELLSKCDPETKVVRISYDREADSFYASGAQVGRRITTITIEGPTETLVPPDAAFAQ